MRNKIWIKVVPQIQKSLLQELFNSRATFECNTAQCTFFISNVEFFSLDTDRTEAMYKVGINTENNSKSLFIAKDNVLEFTVHFQ